MDEQKKGIPQTVIKIILFTVFILIIIGLFWFIFYSVDIANEPLIITARDEYQTTYWKIKGIFFPKQRNYPPFDPIYTIQPVEIEDFTYRFFGKFQNIDLVTGMITLVGSDNKTYYFETPKVIIKAEDPNIVGVSKDSMMQILLADKRTLKQILTVFSTDPQTPLNKYSLGFSVTTSN